MYLELDEDSDNEDEAAILTCIRHVTFISKMPPYDMYKVSQPPYVMDKWVKGIEVERLVECIVQYEVSIMFLGSIIA